MFVEDTTFALLRAHPIHHSQPRKLQNVFERLVFHAEKKFSKEINDLRLQLDNWMYKINDLGDISEKELAQILTQ